MGIHNVVVDAARIEVKRRGRRTQTARLDASTWLPRLSRHGTGAQQVWRVGHVPRVMDADRRHLHRDLEERKAARTQHRNRIKGLRARCGLAVQEVGEDFPTVREGLRLWDGQAVPADLPQRLWRACARMQCGAGQSRDLPHERARRIRTTESAPAIEPVRHLLGLQGLGPNSAWLFVQEFFAGRPIAKRRQRGALAGLPPTPDQSGDRERAPGISKAGNRRLRAMAIEMAWCGVR